MHMTKQDFIKYEADLLANGWIRFNGQIHSEDYYLYKSLHRTAPDEDGDTRNDLTLIKCIYDFTKYGHDQVGIETQINISRDIDERIDIIVSDHDNYEKLAFQFYEFINTAIVPKTISKESRCIK